tara:strand:+ start:471 stop:896 length:426 start_codon:yes stop_codon:yes gene_type:complete
MTYTYDETILSDFYKEAYGYRPTMGYLEFFADLTPAQKQTEWDEVSKAVDIAWDEEAKAYEAAYAKFINRVDEYKNMGATDEVQALVWLVEAELGRDTMPVDYIEPSYMCYVLGLSGQYSDIFIEPCEIYRKKHKGPSLYT